MQKFKNKVVVKIVLVLTLEKLLLGRKQAIAICNTQDINRTDPKSEMYISFFYPCLMR